MLIQRQSLKMVKCVAMKRSNQCGHYFVEFCCCCFGEVSKQKRFNNQIEVMTQCTYSLMSLCFLEHHQQFRLLQRRCVFVDETVNFHDLLLKVFLIFFREVKIYLVNTQHKLTAFSCYAIRIVHFFLSFCFVSFCCSLPPFRSRSLFKFDIVFGFRCLYFIYSLKCYKLHQRNQQSR